MVDAQQVHLNVYNHSLVWLSLTREGVFQTLRDSFGNQIIAGSDFCKNIEGEWWKFPFRDYTKAIEFVESYFENH